MPYCQGTVKPISDVHGMERRCRMKIRGGQEYCWQHGGSTTIQEIDRIRSLLRQIRAMASPAGLESGDAGIVQLIDESGLL